MLSYWREGLIVGIGLLAILVPLSIGLFVFSLFVATVYPIIAISVYELLRKI